MTARAHDVHRMIKTYGRQLTSARRLARFKRSLSATGTEEDVTISRLAKRRALVEQVTREIVENLIVSGSDNEIVQEVERRLHAELGEKFELTYPPAEVDLQIFRVTPGGPQEVPLEEAQHIYKRLWEITLEIVDDTML